MSHSQQDASPQRTATRAPVGKPIRLQFDGETEIIEGICGNISIGGMFIETREARSHGSLVRFDLALDDSESIRGLAEVVWARSKAFGPDDEVGIGIKFRFLEQKDRQLIFKLVSQFIKERLASRQPLTAEPPPPATDGIFHPPDDAAAQDGPDPPTVEVPVVASAGDRQTAPAQHEDPGQAAPSSAVNAPSPSAHADAPRAEAETAQQSDERGAPESLGPSFLDEDPIDLNGRDSGTLWRPDPELTGAIDAPSPGLLRGSGAESEVAPPRRVSRRPKSRSSLMPLLLLGVILAGLVFMFRDKLFGPPPPMDEPLPSQMEPTPGNADGVMDGNTSGAELARRASGTEGSAGVVGDQPQVGTETVGAAPNGAPPNGAAPSGEPSAASTPPPAAAQTPPPPTPQSAPPQSAPPPPAPRPTAPPPPAVSGNEFTEVTDIQWRRLGEGVEITVTVNGVITERRLSNFRLDGNDPREVIQLLGVQRGYSQRTISVDAPGVRQIRTGLNDRRNGKELRLVLDLSGPSARLKELRPEGRRLVIRVEVD